MKIIDAFWEKKNLNLSCKEIVIEENDTTDTLNDIKEILQSTEYIVIKIPPARIDISEMLSNLGFVFIEGSINFKLNLKDAVLSPLQKRLNAAIGYSEMGNQDISELFSQIREGIFNSDRIILDHHFSSSQASTRYINWITDELEKTTKVYKITYKEETIGFFTFKSIDDKIYYPFLAGLYKKYSKSGLGFTTLRKPIEEAIKRGGTMISTYASTNNPIVIRSHTQQGFSINNIQYVFVKHNNKTPQ